MTAIKVRQNEEVSYMGGGIQRGCERKGVSGGIINEIDLYVRLEWQ